MKFGRNGKKRTGTIIVLSAVMMLFIVGMLAFAVDLGYISLIEAEMARSSDAAALAGAWALLDQAQSPEVNMGYDSYYDMEVYNTAGLYVALNPVANHSAAVTWGSLTPVADRDIQIGYLADPWDRSAALDFTDPSLFNAVRVRVRQTAQQNGETPMFFASVLGISSCAQQGEATAVFLNSISGFQTPAPGQTLNVMPFAMDKVTWDALLSAEIDDDDWVDDWAYDTATKTVVAGSDDYPEMNLYPHGTESAGNQGTVDIGGSGNATADIARQILHGVSADDLAYHGGILALDANWELDLNGDTGISAGIKDELAAVIGEAKIIMIYDRVVNPGNTAIYTIVAFAGVRIVEVDLTGAIADKVVMIQPATAISPGLVPAPPGAGTVSSYNVFSPPWIIR